MRSTLNFMHIYTNIFFSCKYIKFKVTYVIKSIRRHGSVSVLSHAQRYIKFRGIFNSNSYDVKLNNIGMTYTLIKKLKESITMYIIYKLDVHLQYMQYN